VYWCAYYQRGKEIRESTGETTEKKALEYLKKRVREVANDRDGIKPFSGPQAERIKIACGVLDTAVRQHSNCGCLVCALERHLLLGGDKKKNLPVDGKLNRGENGILKRLHRDFAGRLATSLKAGEVDAYIERLLCDEDYAKATVNRITQKLAQAYNLAIKRNRLPSDSKPYIRKLSETDNVRQGFFERPEFLLIKAALPGYLQDFVHFGYVTGMRSGEIKSLEWSRTDSNTIRLRAIDAKTGKPRSVPVAGEIAEIIERCHATRNGPWIFHRNGKQIRDYRRAWQLACVLTGLGTFHCPQCDVQLNAKRQCPKCEWKDAQNNRPVYRGKLFHDFRRTAVRDMLRGGANPDVIRSITGHETQSMMSRYNITDDRDQREALRAVQAYRERQAVAQREKLEVLPAPSKAVN
jgi:integrase